VSSNYRLAGQLPDVWGSSAVSMQRLQMLLAHDCNLTGTLPASWAKNLPALGALDLTYNMISGARRAGRGLLYAVELSYSLQLLLLGQAMFWCAGQAVPGCCELCAAVVFAGARMAF
jgi:hypothetical protein